MIKMIEKLFIYENNNNINNNLKYNLDWNTKYWKYNKTLKTQLNKKLSNCLPYE